MAVSQNGYPANNRDLIHNPTVPGTNISFPGGIRKGAVTVVMLYVAVQWHRRIEPLGLGCWGYAVRAIRGSTQTSNHASGTATDSNAPKHPLAKRGTFSTAQRAAMRQIEAEVDHVVRFGEFYSGRVDGMHVEINKPLADVERVAARLLKQNNAPVPASAPAPSSGRRTLKLTDPPMEGPDVLKFQQVANAWYAKAKPSWWPLKPDSLFGPKCDRAARYIQSAARIKIDGEVGDATRKVLNI